MRARGNYLFLKLNPSENWVGGEALLNIYLINKGVAMGVVVGVATVFALIRTFV